ncbi:MAG: family 16 glycosylhydrolase [Paludibacter sp.]
MKKCNFLILIFVFLIRLNLCSQTIDPYLPDASTPPEVTGKSLVWNDEFNVDGKPSTANWKYESGFVRNNELQYYQSANVNCAGGLMVIDGKREAVLNAKYVSGSTDWRYSQQYSVWTSGSVISQGLRQFQYGQIEIRARIDTTLGSWPAIWTKGISGSWPYCGETDIMEFYRSSGSPTILANVAWGSSTSTSGTWNTKKTTLASFIAKDADWCKKFHVWKEVWTQDYIYLYLDGQLLNSQSVTFTTNPTGNLPLNPHQQKHFFLLNLALGSNGGTPRTTTSSYKYEVDYIRVYQDVTTERVELTSNNIKIYPNPVSEQLNVVSDQSLSNITILDLLGRQVLNKKYPGTQISLFDIKPGIYVVKVTLIDGNEALKQIIIN